jgi:hypothetical protein
MQSDPNEGNAHDCGNDPIHNVGKQVPDWQVCTVINVKPGEKNNEGSAHPDGVQSHSPAPAARTVEPTQQPKSTESARKNEKVRAVLPTDDRHDRRGENNYADSENVYVAGARVATGALARCCCNGSAHCASEARTHMRPESGKEKGTGVRNVQPEKTLCVHPCPRYSSRASSFGNSSSLPESSSTLTSLKVSTRTLFTKRSER